MGCLLSGHAADRISPPAPGRGRRGRQLIQRHRRRSCSQVSGTSWWRCSHHLHANSPVLFKIAHMSAENSSLLMSDLNLDANSLKPPASSQHSCVPDVFTQKARGPWKQLPLSRLSVSFYLSPCLSLFLWASFFSPSSLSISISVSLIFSEWMNFTRTNSFANKRIR